MNFDGFPLFYDGLLWEVRIPVKVLAQVTLAAPSASTAVLAVHSGPAGRSPINRNTYYYYYGGP